MDYTECGDLANLSDFFDEAKAKEYRDAAVEELTAAGATFPYGVDPQDSNIRIAPSLPPIHELEQAIAILCDCLRMAALEKLGV